MMKSMGRELIDTLMAEFEEGVSRINSDPDHVKKMWELSQALNLSIEDHYGMNAMGSRRFPEGGRLGLSMRKLQFMSALADNNLPGAEALYRANKQGSVIEGKYGGDPHGTAKAFVQWVEVQGYFGGMEE